MSRLRFVCAAALGVGLASCARCGTDALTSEGDARLVHRSGYEPGITAAAPHAPIVLPYLRHHSNVFLERGERRAVLLDVRPEELRGRPMRLDPSGARFAVQLDAGWTLFFVHDAAETVARDPRALAGPPVWSSAPSWRDRAADVFRATSEPAAVLEVVALDGADALAELTRSALDAPAGERAEGALEWAHRSADRWMMALERLDPPSRASALDALARAYARPDAPEAVLRRARWTLPPERLAVPEAVARSRALRAELDEVERAAALLAAPGETREALACELLSAPAPLPPRLAAAVIARAAPGCEALDAWLAAHACETSARCEDGLDPASPLALSPDLRDALRVFHAAALAMAKHCASGRALAADVVRRRERLRYRFDIHSNIGWDRVSRAACESPGEEVVIDGMTFRIDDAGRWIREHR